MGGSLAGGILTEQERQATVADLRALQRPDGGWAMASLAPWKRIDKTPQDVSNGDGYGTGLVVYVLRVAGGVSADDPAMSPFAHVAGDQRLVRHVTQEGPRLDEAAR